MLALKPKSPAPAGVRAPDARGSEETEERRVLVCRTCGAEITDHGALFCMRAPAVRQVFPNPYGHMRKILTAAYARSVVAGGAATAEFTWFAGYTWRIATCAGCRAHLGWLFEGDGSPPSFYGLLEEALAEA